jgi:L-threonylcarbamoyladenylate synthase
MASTADILRAAEIIRAGGMVAFPTETVYGLGADALSERAVRGVFELKGRPSVNPLIVHVSGPEMAARVVAPGAMSDEVLRLTRALWPGPLSIVLPRGAAVPGVVTGGGPNVAVRCPDHPVALALLLAVGGPLVGPSANKSGEVSPTEASHVGLSLGDSVMVLDGGACRVGIESTVLSLAGGEARVLRPGVITPQEIESVIGRRVAVGAGPAAEGAAHESPGLMSRHYAPSTPTLLLDRAQLEERLRETPWRSSAALVLSELRGVEAMQTLLMPADADEYAGVLYAALRRADAMGVERILIERPPALGGVWAAVLDRLTRASAAG